VSFRGDALKIAYLAAGLGAIAASVRLRLFVSEARRAQVELAERNRQLEDADRLKDELVQVVSHDLRTPLTSIMGYLELALDESEWELPPECRDYLHVAQRNSTRLYRLVEDLLFVSRVKSGRPALDLDDVDLAQLARDTVEMALPNADAAGIELAFRCGVDAEAVADAHRVAEAIENLITNAIKFTPPGGRVDVEVVSDDDAVAIRVSDTGVGVSAEDIEHLFDRFFRTANAEAVPGAGLGLSIVQAVAEAHTGTIDVRPRAGTGTTFELRLPRQQSAVAALESVRA
jgi:signal transduction histidine kinase